MNYYLSLFFLLFYTSLHGVFTNETLTITSFPNISSNGYVFYADSTIIYTDFPINIAPGSKLSAFGTRRNNSFYIKSTNDIVLLKSASQIFLKIARWRITLSQKILNSYTYSGDLILALILGNRFYLDDDFMEYIRFAGLAHMFALSGLHLVIAVGVFLYLVQFLGIQQRYWGISTLPFSILYLFIGGFGIPLQRAVLFHILGSTYSLFRIPTSGKNIFIIAIIINLLFLPNNIHSLSFWLSYLSVLGIVFCYNFWYAIMRKYFNKYISSMLATSLSVSVLISPLLIYFFGYINLFSIVANLFIIPLMPLLLILCFLCVLFVLCNIEISILDIGIEYFYIFLLKVTSFFAELSYGVIVFESKIFGTLISMIILIFMILQIFKEKSHCVE